MAAPVSLVLLLVSNVSAAEQAWRIEAIGQTDHARIFYRVAGEGPPLFLLHGYFGQGNQWLKYVDDFADDFTVIAPDLPGHGRSDAIGGHFDPATAAQAFWQLADQLSYDEISVIGYSAGGMTGLAMAVQQPTRMRTLILAASARTTGGTMATRQWEDLPPPFQADMLRNHPGGIPQVRKLLSAHDIPAISLESVKALQVPVLMVAGDRDESFPMPVLMETYQALPDARFWIEPNLGHNLFWAEWGGSAALEAAFPQKATRFLLQD